MHLLVAVFSVILAGDINAKLGSKIIVLDQCDMPGNGQAVL